MIEQWQRAKSKERLEIDKYLFSMNWDSIRNLNFDQLIQINIGYDRKTDYGGSCFRTEILRRAFERLSQCGIDLSDPISKGCSDVYLMCALHSMNDIKNVIVPDELYVYFKYKDTITHGPY